MSFDDHWSIAVQNAVELHRRAVASTALGSPPVLLYSPATIDPAEITERVPEAFRWIAEALNKVIEWAIYVKMLFELIKSIVDWAVWLCVLLISHLMMQIWK
jgi:hypothetical protein